MGSTAVHLGSGLALAGCSSDGSDLSDANDGDCTVQVLYADHVFRAVQTSSIQEPGRAIDGARFADCDDKPMTDFGTPELFVLPRVDTDEAVLLRDHGRLVVYVNAAIAPTDWPSPVKEAAHGDLN